MREDVLTIQNVCAQYMNAEEVNENGEPMRVALDYALDEYVAQHYPTGTSAVYCSPKGESEQDTYVLCISSGAFQPHNYWNGKCALTSIASIPH
jgi:hypothetical protein